MNCEQLNKFCKDTLMEHLDIVYTEVSDGRIVAKMPVDSRTFQPMKRLHGGATMALAESVGSAGSMTLIDPKQFAVLGVEISGSHVATTKENEVQKMVFCKKLFQLAIALTSFALNHPRV